MRYVVKYIVIGMIIMTSMYVCLFFRQPIKHYNTINSCAEMYNIDASLIASIICIESHYDSDLVSSAGAKGLMQIMDSTFDYTIELFDIDDNIDVFNTDDNIMVGSAYLSYLYERFDDLETVIIAYNAGESTVRQWQKNTDYYDEYWRYIPYSETSHYLKKVINAMRWYDVFY